MARYIDAYKAKNEIRRRRAECIKRGDQFTIGIVEAALDYVETADVALVIHAHWIPKHQTTLGLYPFECSQCGRWETLEFPNDINNMPYCHCGAKMDEEE